MSKGIITISVVSLVSLFAKYAMGEKIIKCTLETKIEEIVSFKQSNINGSFG